MLYQSTTWTRGLHLAACTTLLAVAGLMAPAPASAEGAAPSSEDLVWTDTTTGLMWARCPIGDRRGDYIYCEKGNDSTKYTWADAILTADKLEFAGYSDWRVPTIEEVNALIGCHYPEGSSEAEKVKEMASNGEAQRMGLPPGCVMWMDRGPTRKTTELTHTWVSTMASEITTSDATGKYFLSAAPKPNDGITWGDNNTFTATDRTKQRKLMVVRGGTPDAAYASRIAAAGGAIVAAQEAKEQEQKAQDQWRADEAQARKKMAADIQQARIDYENRTVAIRKNVKPGDKLKNGTVIAVKGNLVQVQVMQEQCTSRSSHLNPHSHEYDCLQRVMVPAGTAWFNRNEILPAP